jgi:hypothetical protein
MFCKDCHIGEEETTLDSFNAMRNGHLNCLIYLQEKGTIRWHSLDCVVAVMGGHLNCLQYAHEHGCPWNKEVCKTAAEYGHLDCLKYLHENGCPWDERTCTAAMEGHLDCLKYAHENGCPWNKETYKRGCWCYIECLKYACENGCPFPSFIDDYPWTIPLDPDIVQAILYKGNQITPMFCIALEKYNNEQEHEILRDFYGTDIGNLIIDFLRLFPMSYDVWKENGSIDIIQLEEDAEDVKIMKYEGTEVTYL